MKTMRIGAMGLAVAMMIGLGACSQRPSLTSKDLAPGITVKADHNSIKVGATTTVYALTKNLIGAKSIDWSTTSNVGHISGENQNGGMVAHFTGDHPGVAVVTAKVQLSDGQMVMDDTAITVNGSGNMYQNNQNDNDNNK